jgi:hypothetical protein
MHICQKLTDISLTMFAVYILIYTYRKLLNKKAKNHKERRHVLISLFKSKEHYESKKRVIWNHIQETLMEV